LTFDGSGRPIECRGEHMTTNELIQGTLDMLILRVLSQGVRHGWGIAKRIARLSGDFRRAGEGSLYRMQDRGWVESESGQSDNNRCAKYYQLTKPGRRRLESEMETLESLLMSVAEVMRDA
jgi:PadR family transcriptional regulator PadR